MIEDCGSDVVRSGLMAELVLLSFDRAEIVQLHRAAQGADLAILEHLRLMPCPSSWTPSAADSKFELLKDRSQRLEPPGDQVTQHITSAAWDAWAASQLHLPRRRADSPAPPSMQIKHRKRLAQLHGGFSEGFTINTASACNRKPAGLPYPRLL